MGTTNDETDELFELEILAKIEQGKMHLTAGGIYYYGHETGDHYDGWNCTNAIASLADVDAFVAVADNGDVALTAQGHGWLHHKTATGPVPTYTEPEQWPDRIGDDPLLIVELVFAHETDVLRDLITTEMTRYRAFATHSQIIRTLAEASYLIEQRSKNWPGDLDDHPIFVLPEACPHPLLDCFGQCEGCGGSPPDLLDSEDDILYAADQRRLTCIAFAFHLDGRPLPGGDDQAVRDLQQAGLLRIEGSAMDPDQMERHVVLTPAGEARMAAAANPHTNED